MGWWDEGIMGGDTPYDIRGWFYDAVRYDQYRDDPIWELGKPNALTILKLVLNERERWMDEGYDEYYLVAPCVAYLVLEHGLPMDPLLLNLTCVDIAQEIQLIKDGGSYFDEPLARRNALEQMLLAVQSYDGTAGSEPDSPGLFERMVEHLEE